MRLDEIFDVRNGVPSSHLSISASSFAGGVPLVRPASTQQRTIVGWIERGSVDPSHIYPHGTLFVSTDGEGSHTYSYVSRFEFVPNSNVSVLIPRQKMSIQEKIFYARCITMNRYRFSYGRKPKGERLKSVRLPALVPEWVHEVVASDLGGSLDEMKALSALSPSADRVAVGPATVKLHEIFDVSYGTDLEMVRMTKAQDGVNFVSRTSKNNGVVARVAKIPGVDPVQGGALSVAGGGSVLETFVQTEPFYSGRDLFVLRPKIDMCIEELMFYAMCIRANQSRYSYGRQANRTLKDIAVPARTEIPSWVYGAFAKVSDDVRSSIHIDESDDVKE